MAEDMESGHIAVIGMAGRFPGAETLERFWENLVSGADVRTTFTDEELAGHIPERLLSKEDYVKKGYVLGNADQFDAAFFGYTPKEAENIDPQQRLFLECAWEALEDAGYVPGDPRLTIGVYASITPSSYLKPDNMLFPEHPMPFFDELIGNDKDYAAARVAYKLDLKGPAFSIQSACSSSLVGVATACQALQDYHCDMALAGGVSISLPEKLGYLAGQDGALSRDACCHAFDHRASGMMYGNGAGVVLLKRLEDAIADGDHIYGVVRGFAVNNDGADKVGFTAPSVRGQEAVLGEALELSGVGPETVTFIETHGTGTPMGDPMEFRALESIYGLAATPCALGSVKTNVGHLNSAAGVAGFIRAMLSLDRKMLTPILHFERPNPEIPFEGSRFYVNTELRPWEASPRRAGVSSFGLGGTNCHMVLEEAPVRGEAGSRRRWHPVPLSARTEGALDAMAERLAAFLEKHPEIALEDVAHTLQKGRKAFGSRRVVIAGTTAELVDSLRNHRWTERLADPGEPPAAGNVYFMFPGAGSQHVGMGRELYETEPVYRAAVDECAGQLLPLLSEDIRDVLYPSEAGRAEAERKIAGPTYAFASLFATEYALARLWMHWGVRPAGCVGHSFGQYLAAVVAGVFSLKDALAVAVRRGQLMDRVEEGAMLLLYAPEEKVVPLLRGSLSVAAVNAEKLCTVSGRPGDIAALEGELTGRRIHYRKVAATRAGHSALMEPILDEFRAVLSSIELHAPQIPFLSNVSGSWITEEDATSPDYWTAHIRRPVRFCENIAAILKDKNAVLLEVGPGKVLGTLAKRHADMDGQGIVFSMRDADQDIEDGKALSAAYGALFLHRVNLDWYAGERDGGRRIPLPTYPFQRQSHWAKRADVRAQAAQGGALASMMGKLMEKREDIGSWFVLPQWRRSFDLRRLEAQPAEKRRFLLLADHCGVSGALARRLRGIGHEVVLAGAGDAYRKEDAETFFIRPGEEGDYKRLLQDLSAQGFEPDFVIHAWSLTGGGDGSGLEAYDGLNAHGYQSVVYLVRALSSLGLDGRPLGLAVLSSGLHGVTGDETLAPEKAPVLGPCRVIPNEYLNIQSRNIDIDAPKPGIPPHPELLDAVIRDVTALRDVLEGRIDAAGFADTVAYRGRSRWEQRFAHVPLPAAPEAEKAAIRRGGVYLITGGFGGVAFELARYLVEGWGVRLVLVGRTPLPPREGWDAWLESHPEDDAVSERIAKVRALEAMGAECLVFAADVADMDRMLAVRDAVLERFGEINGVFHAASTVSSSMIQVQTDERAQAVIRTKVHGTLVLEKMLEATAPDFLMLFSSLCSYTAPLGFTDYAAACCFMDLHAQAMNGRLPYRIVSVGWGYWEGIGIGTVLLPKMMETVGEDVAAHGILAAEGMECISRILALPDAQVMVSTSDYPALVEELRRNAKNVLKNYAAFQAKAKVAKRPRLATPYRAPETDVERVIAAVWQEILGFDSVGVDDAFIELGGDSLHAIPMVSRLESIFHTKVPIRTLVTENTVGKLAAFLIATEKKPGQTARIAELFIKIKMMSADEIKAMLSRKG